MTEYRLAVDAEYVDAIQNDEEKQNTLVLCSEDFREFLRWWKFIDTRTGKQRQLGDELWAGQDLFVAAVKRYPWMFSLKARKLGFTTIAAAYDAWVARFSPNGRVHLFSRRDDAAIALLKQVKYGLKRLPPWMQLPSPSGFADNDHEYEMYAEPDDKRLIKAYPTSEETAVEDTCIHGHVDELARMKNPSSVWQAIEPTMAGSCHILTTGRGPQNFATTLYRQAERGENEIQEVFIDAMQRPDRTEAWMRRKRKGMSQDHFRQEYPMTAEDALTGSGKLKFKSGDLAWAGKGRGPKKARRSHRYVKSWDIGRHADAAVGIVIDVTLDPMEVVYYERIKGMPYPFLQARIEKVHKRYGGGRAGPTVIEANSAGEAVAENLNLQQDRDWQLFKTTGQSKPRMIEGLQIAFENQELRYSASKWPILDSELRGYQIPDDEIIQDSVMALAIGVDARTVPYSRGRVGKVSSWG